MSNPIPSRRVRLCLAAALAVAAGPAVSLEALTGEKAIQAKSGDETQLGIFANLNPTCNGLPAPQVAIVAPPARGTLIVKIGLLRVPDSAANCAGKQVPAMAVGYKVNADVEGTDTVRLDLGMGTKIQSQSYQITVVK
jgi:hypothetical protein